MTFAAAGIGSGSSGLLEKLLAVVRAEFPTEIYRPAPDDPVFVAPACVVADCDRVVSMRGLCNGHVIRWRHRRRPALEDFLADPGPPVRGREALSVCTIEACCYGNFGKGLCSKRYERWCRAGRPDPERWQAPVLVALGVAPAECRLSFCTLWAEGPLGLFCRSHHERWANAGRPDPERFVTDCELTGTAHISTCVVFPAS